MTPLWALKHLREMVLETERTLGRRRRADPVEVWRQATQADYEELAFAFEIGEKRRANAGRVD